MRVDGQPVCPGCWGLDTHPPIFTDELSVRCGHDKLWLCGNPDCLYCYFDPEDPEDQPSEVLFMRDTVIAQQEDGSIRVWSPSRDGGQP